ncbi:yeast yak1, putative [Cryptococcus deneoformans JEC21]|uniref:Yeast yak1, putative n=2 Tax=Cryptococcus deneoformans TaxID=40410 RepID=Q5KB90_CRYD1|nr:yeast yak1, putative [Cryptococcus neoformans var. neoformans JEC21]AAW45566.2 yeast yak1, putative [Cryptococcus neoformans var. neoformans JEC21]
MIPADSFPDDPLQLPLFNSNSPYHQPHSQLQMPAANSYLGRSASLGRKKDPFAYRSDDVESGFGNMDIIDPGQQQPQQPGWGSYGYAQAGYRDSVVSPRSGGYQNMVNQSSMNPLPVPSHNLSRPPPAVPEHPSPTTKAANNAYIPARSSDPGPSVTDRSNSYSHSPGTSAIDPYHPGAAGASQWTEYRRPSIKSRMPSSSSYASRGSDGLSPFISPGTLDTNVGVGSPGHSPLLNPNDIPHAGWSSPSMPHIQPPSPRNYAPQSTATRPQASPVGGRPPPTSSRPLSIAASQTQGQTLYPASQPTTPQSRYDPNMPPPQTIPSRSGAGSAVDRRSSSAVSKREEEFRDIRGLADLRAVVNALPNGRRADPDAPGKYLSPLKCLTSSLPETYTLCNPSFRYVTSDNPRRVLTKPSKPVHNDGADNEDWDYILYVNDVLGGEDGRDRYLILDVLGQGTFGQVVKCQNMRTHDLVAVKVVKNKPAYLQQSKMEVAILELLNTQHDPQDRHHILRMHDSFTHKHHLCLVFECLSSNLYELIKQNQFKGLSTQLVKVFTQQLLDCLSVLKDARLIHCDLKPENILLKSLQSPQIKVIDFGSACHEMQTVYTYIQSRFYRSPEVLLGLPYSTSIDMWSLGCIVVELFLGLPLFPGTSEYNQISRIVDMLGNPPSHLLEVGKQTHEFFNITPDAYGRNTYKLKPMQQYSMEHRTDEQPSKQYFKQTKLKDVIMEYPYAKKSAKQSDIDKEMATRRSFVDFAEGLLNMDPIKRWSPQQALKHPFITGEKWTGPWQPDATTTAKKLPVSSAESSPSTSTPSKKYGGLVQSPPSSRSQRIYSDAAAYNQQLAQHQSYTAQVQAQQNAQRAGPFSSGYDIAQAQAPAHTHAAGGGGGGSGYGHQRVVSQQMPSTASHHHHAQQRQPSGQWGQQVAPPSSAGYQQRGPSVNNSGSHASLRQPPSNVPVISNPPPNSYYPASRHRANTINQMDAIPPALARLVHFGAQDPNGSRNSLTPVLNRDDAIREWERRQQGGHSKQSSLHNASYPQLEYLQEQAELAAMQGQNWMMPGPYPPHHGRGHVHRSSLGEQSHGHGHRTNPSGQYQMQPHIGISPSNDYRPRPTSEYDPPSSTSSARGYGLPTYPPLAATTSHPPGGSVSGAVGTGQGVFDAFDGRDGGMGMLYTPLQPNQAYGYQGHAGQHGQGHATRASYSGPYSSSNPFANQPNSPRY